MVINVKVLVLPKMTIKEQFTYILAIYSCVILKILVLTNNNVPLLFVGCVSDINECKERSACQCDGCSCQNTWGGFECKCKGNLLYIKEQDACIGKTRNLNDYPHFLHVENFTENLMCFMHCLLLI